MNEQNPAQAQNHSLSFTKLTAMIIGSTIGGGIFTTAGDMAASGAHTGSVLIGWTICGIGMFCLMMCFFGLNRVRPDLTNGIYSYAQGGLRRICRLQLRLGLLGQRTAMQCFLYNFAVWRDSVISSRFSATATTCSAIVCASAHHLACSTALILPRRAGGRRAQRHYHHRQADPAPALCHRRSSLSARSDPAVFMEQLSGAADKPQARPPSPTQIKATTSATVWSFIGVEGAVVLSARAKHSADVGKASLTGFLGIFAIYVLVAILSMGVLPTEELASLKSPQMAGILQAVIGPWGAAIVNIGVILSLAGALLGWTILAADCPYSAARQGVFLKAFARANPNGSPSFALYLTNGLVQLFLIVIFFSASTYQVFYTFSTTMIMIPYFLSALYYLKVTLRGEGFPRGTKSPAPGSDSDANIAARGGSLATARFFAIIGTAYGIWMLYSSGLELTFIACILYAPGILVYALGKKKEDVRFSNVLMKWSLQSLCSCSR